MKNKDLMFYAIAAFSVTLLLLLPIAIAAGLSIAGDFPGTTFFQEWIKSGNGSFSVKIRSMPNDYVNLAVQIRKSFGSGHIAINLRKALVKRGG